MFPGQASQYVGMGKFWFERYEIVRQCFEEASEILGFDLTDLCFHGPKDRLKQTENTQPALLTLGVAIFRVLIEEKGLKPSFLAGHSIGELTALTAAGVFSLSDGVQIARLRGEAMASCEEGANAGMMAATQIKEHIVESVISEFDPEGRRVQIANYNAPTQTVLSGTYEGLHEVSEQLKQLGANMIPLNVSGPFHSHMMADAEELLEAGLEPIKLNKMSYPVMCGHEGRLYTEDDHIKNQLVSQLTRPIRWTKTLTTLSKEGADEWLEVGPQTVLKSLTLTTLPEAKVYALDHEEDWNSWLTNFRAVKSQLPNFIGLCLGAAVSTRNTNWDEEAYQKGVIEPYKEIEKIHHLVNEENRKPNEEEMKRALSLLKKIFETKGIPKKEQQGRIQHILHETSTNELFRKQQSLVGADS